VRILWVYGDFSPTLYIADGRTANQIDHVLISNRFRSAIADIRAQRGPDRIRSHLIEDKL